MRPIDHEKYRRQTQTSNLVGILPGLAAVAVFLILLILARVFSS